MDGHGHGPGNGPGHGHGPGPGHGHGQTINVLKSLGPAQVDFIYYIAII